MQALSPSLPHLVLATEPASGGSTADERLAFERRMAGAWPGIVRLVERLLAWPGASGEVEDVAQEVFLAAWRGRGTFRGDAEWSTWLHAIAVRRAANAARSRRRRQRWFGRLIPGATLLASDEPAASAPAAGTGGVSAATQRALAALKHSDRELLVLRYLEEHTAEELIDWLELSRAAFDARLSRARARLKSLLDDEREGAEAAP